MKRTIATGALVMTLIAGCGSQTPGPGASASSTALATSPASPAASVPPSAAGSPEASASSPLAGVWHTKAVSKDEIVAALQRCGQQKWIQPVLAKTDDAALGSSNVFTLRIENGRWLQYWSKDGGVDNSNDDGAYTIEANTVTVRHGSSGSDIFGWSVSGGELGLTVTGDTFPTTNDVPEAAYMCAFYAASPYLAGHP
ncbi:MAG TPA: hypothetical protein VIM30_11805 [Candidatus Limnocylindrales bacterium]